MQKMKAEETEILIEEFKEKKKITRDKITDKQMQTLEARAEVIALKGIINAKKWAKRGNIISHMLNRKYYFGEAVLVDGKWIKVHERNWLGWAQTYAAGVNKAIANIELFPYLTEIPGIKFNQSYTKALAQVQLDGGIVGDYLGLMVEVTTGLIQRPQGLEQYSANAIRTLNTYFSRFHLSFPKSAIKNWLLAQGMLAGASETSTFVRNSARSFQYRLRMEAKKTGMMQLSYSAMTENERNWFSKNLQTIFEKSGFPSSEEVGRYTQILSTLDEIPYIHDSLVSKNKRDNEEAIRTLKDRYMLTDTPIKISENLTIKGGEIQLFKIFGLGAADIDWQGKGSTAKFGVGVERTKPVTFNSLDVPITVLERAKIKKIKDTIDAKIMMMAHEKTSGSTIPIFQPYWVSKYPLLKAGALYAQLAMSANYNSIRLIRENHKNRNWWRTFRMGGWKVGVTPAVMIAMTKLLNGIDPLEMDEDFWRRMLYRLQIGEVGSAFSFISSVLRGDALLSAPFLGFAAVKGVWADENSFKELVMDTFRAGLSKVGDPKGKRDYADYFIRNDIEGRGVKKFFENLAAAYRGYKKLYKNYKFPYYLDQKDIDKFEREFYETMEANPKPKIIANTVMNPYYVEMKESFTTSDNWDDFNEDVLNAWQEKFIMESSKGEIKPSEAIKRANQAIEQKIASLHPTLNGTGTNKEGKWYSHRTKYLSWLLEKGKRMKKSKNPSIYKIWRNRKENYYVEKVLTQEILYQARVNAWAKQWGSWLEKQSFTKNDEHLKGWKKVVKFDKKGNYIHPDWEKLGLISLPE